ncbi:hypothetical protein L249_5192, partial [Ophiocordyceps polyrhachis-furcata BCC 54312]
TRPEGLGGSRDAGPAAAGPRPPYVTAAVRHNNRRRLRHGYAVQRLRPYGPYGPYEGRNGVVFPPPKLVTETGGLSGVFFFSTMLRYSFALRSRLQRQQRQQTQKDHLITGCQEGGRTRGPRQQTSRPSSSFLRQGSQRPIPRSFFSTFAADTATATATANALVATVPLLLFLSLSNALFDPIFSAAFFVLWSSVLFFPPSSSYGRPYSLQRRQERDQDQDQGQDQQQNTGTSREQQSQQPLRQPLQQEQRQQTIVPTAVPYLRPPQSLPSSSYSSSSSSLPESFVVLFVFFFVFSFLRPYPPPTTFSRKGNSAVPRSIRGTGPGSKSRLATFLRAPPCLRQIQVLTEDLPWPAAKTALLRYYGAFDQIRTVGFYEKLRRHEARRPKTKDTIDWLEKHAFFCRKVGPGPGPGPDESTEHSYGLFQALPKEIQEGHVTPGRLQPARGRRTSQRLRRLRHGYAVQRLRPYGPYGPYEGRNVGTGQARRAFFSNIISLRRLRPYGPYGPYEGRNVG